MKFPIYYDPMIGKLIVWATNREYAIERMRRVLHEYKLTGVKNNISYLRAIMDTPVSWKVTMIQDSSPRTANICNNASCAPANIPKILL